MNKTYPIAENDLIEVIKTKLATKKSNGELDKLHQDLTKKGKDFVKRPPGKELPRAINYRAFAIDPTYILPNDLKNAEGKILYPAGFNFNPLDIKPLTRALCFVNADDPEQIEWLENICNDDINFKRIIVYGDFGTFAEKTDSRVYFDQKGYLISHFRIQALPAVVRQSGNLLYVEEFDI